MNNQVQYIEKKNISKHSLHVGSALLLSLGIQYALVFVLIIVLLLIGYSQNEMNSFLTDTYSGYLVNTIICAVFCTFPFLILKRINKKEIHEICSFNSTKVDLTVKCVLFIFGASMLANIITSVFNEILYVFFDFQTTMPTIGDTTFDDPMEFLYTVVCSAILPALVEEFAFRGMILGTLRKFGDIPAVIVSALLFGLLHGNFIQIPFAFLIGIALGLVTVITNSIWPAIIGHFVNNFYAVVVNSVAENHPVLSMMAFYLIIVIGIVSLIKLIREGNFRRINKQPSSLSGASKFFRMICSPTVIIYIVFMLITAFLN